MPLRLRQLAAEFFGVFCIVFIGSGSIMMNAAYGTQGRLLGSALAYAMTIAAIVASMSHLSADFNPAVTLGMVVARRTGPVDALLKVSAQCAGGIFGAWLLARYYPPALLTGSRIGGTMLGQDVPFMHGVVLEAITTGILVLVVFGVIRNGLKPGIAGVVVGFVVGALIILVGPLTGASLNPARSLGPALVSGVWEAHAVYWIGPMSGALVAALLWVFVFDDGKRPAVAGG